MREQNLQTLGGLRRGSAEAAVRKALMQSKLASAEVPLELGGKTRHLCLNMNAMVRIEDETGLSVIGGNEAIFSNLSARRIRTFIWAMLADELDETEFISQDRLTELQVNTGMNGEQARAFVQQQMVGRWIDMANMEELIEKMNLAFTKAMPEPEANASPEGTARKNARSSVSTGS